MTADFYGMNPPFIGGAENILSRQEDERLIKNDILQLLLTVPGERVMRPTFGINLRNFVFENFDERELSLLKTSITQELTAQEPRIIIDTIDITSNPDDHKISLHLVVVLKNNPERRLVINQLISGGGEI